MSNVIDLFFNPKAIAVIGASREEEKPGHVILRNLLLNKEKGVLKSEVYPVNPKAKEILGVKCYPSVKDIPGIVDSAVIVVPARIVPAVMEDCGQKGVKAVTIISAGFSEIGNVELEKKVLEIARKYGIRIIGPNCLGIFDAYTGIDTIFLPYYKVLRDGRKLLSAPRPKPGYISMISQSGALGNAALDYMSGENIGINKFVSYGNKIDVDECDLIEYFSTDGKTRAVIMYLENIKRGRKFISVAEKASLKIPIVALKAGRTKAGAKAAASHTAALAGVDEIYEAAFEKCGVIRAYDMEEFFDFGKALAYQPPAGGDKIAVLTDGGGAGVMAADEIELQGMKVAEFSKTTKEKFKELKEKNVIPYFASTENPVDITGSATTEMYDVSLRLLLEDPQVDGVVLIALHHIPGIPSLEDFVEKLSSTIKSYSKPVTVCVIGGSEAANYIREEFDKRFIPSYPSPERAVRSMRALVKYGLYLKKKGVFEEYLKNWSPIS
ncbi:MAG TPA: CoA-binding protein [Thermoproteales archaeon]|nr:CoA-binding protein [Thermoproteales archaeon]